MSEAVELKLPPELEPYREQFEQSIKPYIKITTKKEQTLPWQSKFGGDPYCPLDFDYPTDHKGKPLRLLAQINFKEIPKLEPFPATGVLQFYISADDDVHGIDSEKDRKIVYFPDVIEEPSQLVRDFSFVQNTGNFPLSQEGKLHFELAQTPVSTDDFHFAKLLGKTSWDLVDDGRVWDFYQEHCPATGHKMGGYAFFTQYDPRNYSHQEHSILLLQMDTDDELNLMWGDAGVANFFIRPDDLKNLDFQHVLYNWDCF